jgi:hypothetical protein
MDVKERVKFIFHEGVRILLVDASELREPDEIIAVIDRSIQLSKKEREKSLLAVTDATNTHFNDRILKATKRATKHNAQYFKVSATVGVTGLKKVLLPLVAAYAGRVMKNFATRKQALDWLVSKAGD